MLAVRLPESMEHELDDLAEKTGRTKSYYVREAVAEYLTERKDLLLAVERLKKKNPRISLEEMERRLGLED